MPTLLRRVLDLANLVPKEFRSNLPSAEAEREAELQLTRELPALLPRSLRVEVLDVETDFGRVLRARAELSAAARGWVAVNLPGKDCELLRRYLLDAKRGVRGASVFDKYEHVKMAVKVIQAAMVFAEEFLEDETPEQSLPRSLEQQVSDFLQPPPPRRPFADHLAFNPDWLVGVNKEGRFQFSPDPIFQAMENVEVARIRECICGRFFWAARKDQPCCSKTCANRRRVNRWRERYAKTYKIRRALR